MKATFPLDRILFFDIETVSTCKSYSDLSERMQELWTKKHRILVKDNSTTPTESYTERAGIYAEFGKIVCISCGYFHEKQLRIKSFYGDDEKSLLVDFSSLLNSNFNSSAHYTLSGHNIKEFDVPYVSRRMLIHGVKLPDLLNVSGKKPWEVNFIDTLQLWKFGDYKAYTSLDLLAAIFNIPTPKDDIDGSQVGKVYWEEQDIGRITEYCQKDVVTVVNLYLKLIGLDMINERNVAIV